MKVINILTIFLLMLSCTTMNFHGKDDFPSMLASPKSTQKLFVEKKIDKYYLLWGILPDSHDINIGEYVSSYNVRNAGNFVIKQSQSFSQQLLSVLSIGLYVPYTIEFKAWADKKEVSGE